MDPADQLQILFHRQIGRDRCFLGRYPDQPLHLFRCFADAAATHQGISGRRPCQAGQHFQGCGLSCAVYPKQGKQFPLPDFQLKPVHGSQAFVPLNKLCRLYCRHFCRPPF